MVMAHDISQADIDPASTGSLTEIFLARVIGALVANQLVNPRDESFQYLIDVIEDALQQGLCDIDPMNLERVIRAFQADALSERC